jgi:protein transport protein SEC23
MSNFDQDEDANGVRFTWNVWPSSRLAATRLIVPLASVYTPLKQTVNVMSIVFLHDDDFAQPFLCSPPLVINQYNIIIFRFKKQILSLLKFKLISMFLKIIELILFAEP